MDLIRHAMRSKENYTTERLNDDYMKMFKSDPRLMYIEEEPPTTGN